MHAKPGGRKADGRVMWEGWRAPCHAGRVHELIEEWDAGLHSLDPLGFPGYADKVARLDGESVRTGRTAHYVLIEGRFGVLGGSLGVVAGEKVVRAFDRAVELGLPVVCITRSGGARMQEGMVALVQLARTAAAVRRHHEAGLLSLAVHQSPTTGGTLASYSSLCDLRAVEAGATLGFAGPRVVEQLTGELVGDRSHTAETALAHGLVDAVVPEGGSPVWIELALGLRDEPLPVRPPKPAAPMDASLRDGAWTEVLLARRPDRPTGIDVAAAVCTSWAELGGVDPVIRAGLATLADRRVVVIATDRHAGSGMPVPAGFRLAQRAIGLAGQLGLPLVTLVDTPGADPGSASENDGLALEIARTHMAMSGLATTSVSVCVGEGGSGGALALSWADRLFVQEHAIYSVIGPEGAAAILERDGSKAPQVAEHLALTSADLLRLRVVDAVVPDDLDGLDKRIDAALRDAEPGDRRVRADAASAPWVADG